MILICLIDVIDILLDDVIYLVEKCYEYKMFLFFVNKMKIKWWLKQLFLGFVIIQLMEGYNKNIGMVNNEQYSYMI